MTVAFVLANSDHGSIIVNRQDYNHSFNDQIYGVGAQIFENGSYDPKEVETIRELLCLCREYRGPGVVALDCGANVGVHALEWSALMRGWGHVLAIEAQERIFYALAGNLSLHNAFNARAIWAAVGSEEGFINIAEPDYRLPSSFGSFELRERLGNENIGQTIDRSKPTSRVRLMKIDNAGLERVDLIKMDVEGMELEALAGAAGTIEAHKPVLYVETIKISGRALNELLVPIGYRLLQDGMNTLCIYQDDPIISHLKIEKMVA